MGFLDRFFGKNRTGKAATAADVARGQKLQGHEVGQTLGEQAGTRRRMQAELVAQRERRTHAGPTDA
jgi:hypothetical protein